MTETATVPRELLRGVLDQAEKDSRFSQDLDLGRSLAETLAKIPLYGAKRARIAELRKAAGLDDD